jgi:hypothetical protein
VEAPHERASLVAIQAHLGTRLVDLPRAAQDQLAGGNALVVRFFAHPPKHSEGRDMTMISEDRLTLAIDRLGGLQEIHRSTYAEFFDDAQILADAARELLSLRTFPPPSGEAGERANHLRMLAFRDIFEFRPDSTTGKDAFEQIAIHARSTVIETQKAIAALPTIKEPTEVDNGRP